MLVPELRAATVFSVGVEPNGVPKGVLHRPGGPETFVEVLRDQLRRRADVPRVAATPGVVDRGRRRRPRTRTGRRRAAHRRRRPDRNVGRAAAAHRATPGRRCSRRACTSTTTCFPFRAGRALDRAADAARPRRAVCSISTPQCSPSACAATRPSTRSGSRRSPHRASPCSAPTWRPRSPAAGIATPSSVTGGNGGVAIASVDGVERRPDRTLRGARRWRPSTRPTKAARWRVRPKRAAAGFERALARPPARVGANAGRAPTS